MAETPRKFPKMISAQLRKKAQEFLENTKDAFKLADILNMFDVESDHYTPLLLTVEVIFCELLKRGDLVQNIVPLKPGEAEGEYTKWLRECYDATFDHCLRLITQGRVTSRLQALVTACKLMQAEGCHPLEDSAGYYFPTMRLKSIFKALLHSELSMTALLVRFQEFTEYRDVQQYGLKVLSTIGYRKAPSNIYMQNYLELLDKLLINDILDVNKTKEQSEDPTKKQNIVLCGVIDRAPFPYNPGVCKRYANKCWAFACQWALRDCPRTHRRALLLLVERMMPLLNKPRLATDMLCDSLDAGGPISMLALQGVLELVRNHNITYPDMYDRLYAMFEPEMFCTRYKRRLLHIADVFLSSTHLPESLVAAFAKRLSRLALLAAPEDAALLLQLVANLLLRHPALKRMVCLEDHPHIMSNDPYIMEETCAANSRALGSSLWEVAALRRHFAAAPAAAAASLLEAQPPQPIRLEEGSEVFEQELQKRFKTIEMNFIRPQTMELSGGNERLLSYWELMA